MPWRVVTLGHGWPLTEDKRELPDARKEKVRDGGAWSIFKECKCPKVSSAERWAAAGFRDQLRKRGECGPALT